jgi:hypothetical protein
MFRAAGTFGLNCTLETGVGGRSGSQTGCRADRLVRRWNAEGRTLRRQDLRTNISILAANSMIDAALGPRHPLDSEAGFQY